MNHTSVDQDSPAFQFVIEECKVPFNELTRLIVEAIVLVDVQVTPSFTLKLKKIDATYMYMYRKSNKIKSKKQKLEWHVLL